MRSRRRGDDDDSGCYFCRGSGPADRYDFYAGFCIDFQRSHSVLTGVTRTRATYRDLKRYSVSVCEECASRARLKRHLPGAIGWGLGAVACGIGAAVAAILQIAGDQTIYLLGVLGLFGVLSGGLALIDLGQLFLQSSPAVTLLVLEWVKADAHFKTKGDSFFGPEEYRVLFKDNSEPELSAEEILARDRTGAADDDYDDDRPRRPKKRKKKADTKPCPHCEEAIPSYAHACPHCKNIISQ